MAELRKDYIYNLMIKGSARMGGLWPVQELVIETMLLIKLRGLQG